VRQVLDQRRGRVKLEQVILGLRLVADLVGKRPPTPIVVALDRTPRVRDRGLHVGRLGDVAVDRKRVAADRAYNDALTAVNQAIQQLPPLPDAERKFYTRGTDLVPVDGIGEETADRITAHATTEIEKAHAIYEWVVANTFRDAKVRGCGTGDVATMLKTGSLGGKCADLNALFVALARASGLPARDIYGIRIAPSRFGYKSLGAGSDIARAGPSCAAVTGELETSSLEACRAAW